jgi:hypothetical protein
VTIASCLGKRGVTVKNVKASHGKMLVGISSNEGDKAHISSTCATAVKEVCVEYQSSPPGEQPKKLRSGRSDQCVYSSVAVVNVKCAGGAKRGLHVF